MAKRKIVRKQEMSQSYRALHVDMEGLNQLFKIMRRIRKSKGFLGPQHIWYDKECPSLEVPMEYNPPQVRADRLALRRAVAMRDILKPATDVACKIHKLISSQLEVCEAEIEAYQNRRGFLLLPDEVLSMVLEHAAVGSANEGNFQESYSTIQAAARLSHVCRRFRSLITHSPSLWQTIFKGMSSDMVLTCLLRCTRGNAKIFLPMEFSPSESDPKHYKSFIHAVVRKPENWGNFTMHRTGDSQDTDFEGHRLRQFARLTKGIDLLNLSKLSISYPSFMLTRASRSMRDIVHFYSTWYTPKLQSMEASSFIPIPFSGTSTLTSLKLVLHLQRPYFHDILADVGEYTFDVESMVSLLASCPLLLDLTLEVHNATSDITPASLENRVEMQYVTKLDVDFSDSGIESIKQLFTSVRFPKVSTMRLKLKSQDTNPSPDFHFCNIFRAVVPDGDALPNLVDMKLEAYNYGGAISIPLDTMPHLRSLELQTMPTIINPIPEFMHVPAIRTLVLRNCFQLEEEWLTRLLKRSVDQGNLEILNISIHQCDELRRAGIQGSLTKEDILKIIA